ncbi:MAG: hypothetical protein J6J31_03650 [Thermoguttaceae bacterium]|nr:hypothetical protein [Thermoguttaceae bacterium]
MKIKFQKLLGLGFLSAVLFVGCGEEKQDAGSAHSASSGVAQRGDANDPRWRNELFQSSVAAIRERAACENPEQYLNSLNQVTDRFNGWIQSRPPFEGWRPDPMTAQTVEILDLLEPLQTRISEAFRTFRNVPDSTPLTETQAALLKQAADELKDFQTQIPENAPNGFVLLRTAFQKMREVLLFHLIQGQVSPDLKNVLRQQHAVFQQLGILTGSKRMSFSGSEKSTIPLTPDETFTMAYENDVYVLFEQFLLQDVSLWAQGTPQTDREEIRLELRNRSDTTGAQNLVQVSSDDLERMKSIFSWTFANVQTLPDTAPPRLPLEVLLSGEGTALERAWLCILLARQQDLNAFLIEVPSDSGTRLLLGFLRNEEIYLFDPVLGLPVWLPADLKMPADMRKPWDAVRTAGALDAVPARWTDICAEPAILGEFWRLAGWSGNVTAESLSRSRVLLEASPWYQTQRMAILQDALKNGENRVVMSLAPVEVLADGTISRDSLENAFNAPSALKDQILRKNAFASVEIWTYPVNAVVRRALDPESEMNRLRIFQLFCTPFPDGFFNLWRGRMLYLKGILTGPMSAAGYYQKARLSETVLEQTYPNGGPALLDFYRGCRCEASYVLGMISFVLNRPEAACDSFTRHVLETGFTRFHASARLRCGMMCERKENWQAAREFYAALPEDPAARIRLAFLPKEGDAGTSGSPETMNQPETVNQPETGNQPEVQSQP